MSFMFPTHLLSWWQQSHFVFGFSISLPSYFYYRNNNRNWKHTYSTSPTAKRNQNRNQSHSDNNTNNDVYDAYIHDQYIVPLTSAIQSNRIEEHIQDRIPAAILYTIHEFANLDGLVQDYQQWQTSIIEHKKYYFVVPIILGYIESCIEFLSFLAFVGVMLRILRIESAWLSLVFRGLEFVMQSDKVSAYFFYYWLIVCVHFVCSVICYFECCTRMRMLKELEQKLSETENEYHHYGRIKNVFKLKDCQTDKVSNLFSLLPLQHWLNIDRANIKYHFVNRLQRGHYFRPFYLQSNACKLWLLFCRYHQLAVYYVLFQAYRWMTSDDSLFFTVLPLVIRWQFKYYEEFKDANANWTNTWKQLWQSLEISDLVFYASLSNMGDIGAVYTAIVHGNESDGDGDADDAELPATNSILTVLVGICSQIYALFTEYETVLFGTGCFLFTVVIIGILIWRTIVGHHAYYVLPRYLLSHARELRPQTANANATANATAIDSAAAPDISVLENIKSLPRETIYLPAHTNRIASRLFGLPRRVSCRILHGSLYMCFRDMFSCLLDAGRRSVVPVVIYTHAMQIPLADSTLFWFIPCVLWCLALAFGSLYLKQESECVMSGLNRAQYALKYMAPNIYLYVWRQLLTLKP